MRIAIIGTGVAGLTTAWLLNRQHDITVFEAGERIGGHVNTIDVPDGNRTLAIDTGFIVFNRRTYPNFCRLLEKIGVAAQPSDMSFAVSCQRTGVEWNGSSIPGMFVQPSNLLSPSFHGMWRDILTFNRLTKTLVEAGVEIPLRQVVAEAKLGKRFWDHYLVPLCAAIWSMPPERIGDFPARFLARFLDNHGMNTVDDRPQWYTITGGSATYVRALTAGFAHKIRTRTPVLAVSRQPEQITVLTAHGAEPFDRVVLATHSNQALRMLAEPTIAEREILSAIPFAANRAVLHRDATRLPKRKRAWAAWNVTLPAGAGRLPELTYWMNRLQRLESTHTYGVTLNPFSSPDETIGSFDYEHPQFASASPAAQARWREINGADRVWYAGAWWLNGFHEDGVVSALRVGADFAEVL